MNIGPLSGTFRTRSVLKIGSTEEPDYSDAYESFVASLSPLEMDFRRGSSRCD